MIPMSFQRSQVLFGAPLAFVEFVRTVEGNPHHWYDTEAVKDAAHEASDKARASQCAQRFVLRVRNGNYDGREYASLVFEVEKEIVTFKEWGI